VIRKLYENRVRYKTCVVKCRSVSRGDAWRLCSREFFYDDRRDYFNALNPNAEPIPSISFGGLAEGSILGHQFADLGLRFTDGDDVIASYSDDGTGIFVVDGAGAITVQFDRPLLSLGIDFFGRLRIEPFRGDGRHGVAEDFPVGGFGGIISEEPFDRVVLSDFQDGRLEISALYFYPVPEPSTCALLLASLGWHFVLGSIAAPRGRRR
jgi:hypothetical protein